MVRRCAREGGYAVLYGHPHSLSVPGPQSFDCLRRTLAIVKELVRNEQLQVVLPRDICAPPVTVAREVFHEHH
jgi:hypothetical protein